MCDHCGCRAFAEIAQLTIEHQQILTLAWQLAEAPAGADRDRLVELLGRHVVKEENGLYPLLVGIGTLDPSTVDALEAEHNTLEAAIAGPGFDRRSFYELAAHIEQEEMELFPAAMFDFDEHEWETLATIHRAVDATAEANVDTDRRIRATRHA